MPDVTVSYRVAFRKREGSALVRAPRAAAGQAPPAEPSPTARLLAFAYWIERQVRSGALKDYREAARRLGVSHARISQLVGLLMLPPAVQADVIVGTRRNSECALRRLASVSIWLPIS